MAAKPELIDERVSAKQCKLAIEALLAHEIKKIEETQESELLPRKETHVWLNVALKQMPSGAKVKPFKIPIVHPLVDPRTTAVCLITKDPQREYKDLLEKHNIKFISRVVGVQKLRGKFKPFEARRLLLKENGLFLADDRVVPLLPKLLGSKWFEAKKQPIPVCITRKDLKGELERAISSTYMNQNKGTCTSIKIGIISQKPTQIFENLQRALPVIAQRIQGGWDNIQALYIKTNSSVTLPIWTCSLEKSEGDQWKGISINISEDGDAGSEDDDEGMKLLKNKTGNKLDGYKGKKRSQEEVQEVSKPKKKVKAGVAETSAPELTNKTALGSPPKISKIASAAVDAPRKARKPRLADQAPALRGKDRDGLADPLVENASSKKPAVAAGATPVTGAQRSEDAAGGTTSHKKRRKQLTSTDMIPENDLVTDTYVSSTIAPSSKREAKSKSGTASAINTAGKAAFTADELKQKRSVHIGEKKKKKIKSVPGKSAKEGLLGKKVTR